MSKKKTGQKSGLGAGILAFGVVFALYSVIFHPHSVGGYALAAALSGAVGAIIRIMAQGLDTSQNQKTPESLKKMQGETGDPDVDALLEKGREAITEIRRENELIPDSSLSGKLDILENQCAEIFRTVFEKPEKAPQIRKFMDYYLPTTLKMVKGYRMLDERGVTGAEAVEARQRIDDALGVVIQGCSKLMDKLYQGDVLDLATDIDVLEQMLKRDGLTEGDLEAAAQQARNAARINQAADRIAAQKQAQQQTQAQKPAQAMPRWHMDERFRPAGDQAVQHRPEEQ